MWVRTRAAEALGRLGPAAAPVAAQVAALLADSEAYVRRSAAVALGEMGQAAAPFAARAAAARAASRRSHVTWAGSAAE